MALQISYTDERGVTNTEAYARIENITQNLKTNLCSFRVSLFHNVAARSKSDETQRKQLIDSIEYKLWGSNYTTYLSETVLKEADKTILSQLYIWLKAHKDLRDAVQPEDRENHGRDIDWTTATDV